MKVIERILDYRLSRDKAMLEYIYGYRNQIMSILETWTLNDFAENQETLFHMMRVFLSGMNASPQTLN